MLRVVGFSTLEGMVHGVLHPAENARSVLVVGDAGGETHGPVSIYEDLATPPADRGRSGSLSRVPQAELP